MKAKEAKVQESAFLKLPTNLIKPPVISSGSAYTNIIKEVVAQILMI